MRVMEKMGFGTKWREWIWSCISTAKFSVLVNGELAGFFPSSKGLRQGDPLSPYLFIMGMEVLSALLRRAVEGGCITGCRIQRGRGQAVSISHLLFADDAIVFCEAKKKDMTFLSWTLCWFEAASGLRINLAKSEIIPVGEVDEILEMAVELGCKVGQLPSTYLGLPLGAPNKAGYVWDGVEERMRWKLALWKRQYLSKGGRITLIKSTLVSMPLYQLSLFRMPKGVARRLEKLQRDFLWGGGSTGRKAHLVSWEKVCVSKEKGGLGLRKIVQLNKALLGKWVWRFARAKDEMWKRVLVAKYGQEEFGWRTKKANGAFGVGLWKEIMKEADWCWSNMTLKVGKDTKIRFWKDTWCGDVELAWRFPQLFNVAAQKSATVGFSEDKSEVKSDPSIVALVQGTGMKTAIKKKIIKRITIRMVNGVGTNNVPADRKKDGDTDETKNVSEQAVEVGNPVSEPNKLEKKTTPKTKSKTATFSKQDEKAGSVTKAKIDAEKQKVSQKDSQTGKRDKSKDQEESKDEKEKDGKYDSRVNKPNKDAKEEKHLEEPPRHPGLFLQTNWSKDSKVS
ncbi:hypothetical protein VitviT2T_014517 [Vitis vinifera]|uniref:Reverse transcriptase domain-containing protein n=1 Tax=Vitis vinifera TaxID=29760 RepID=A0ABY9CKS4_VITVI|nr:hypothetical protein VitviT2T_014517 [Vitis vinifera]